MTYGPMQIRKDLKKLDTHEMEERIVKVKSGGFTGVPEEKATPKRMVKFESREEME